MHDITFIRTHPDQFDAALRKRHLPALANDILALDGAKRVLITEISTLQAQRNQLAKEIGEIKKAKGNADSLMETSKDINERIKMLEEELSNNSDLDTLLQTLPNMLQDDVPVGADEQDNVQVRTHLTPPTFTYPAQSHELLGEALGLMDFEGAAKLSGARFVLLKGALARLERALAQFMLDTHTTQFGYTEVSPPLLVRDNAMFGTGQLPKFTEDSFCTTNGYWLIPTAEVSLTNMVAESILHEEELPLRYCAFTPCFRSEAGSAGRDTRGMLRQHQFYKVELVSITTPEQSAAEHERKLAAAEHILQQLKLPYRVMLLCSGDTGFSASKTYDIEVWLPAQNTYREISSVSNCTAFQARRMRARYRHTDNPKKIEAVHTLNGSGLAVGRTLLAVMEHYQQEDGSIAIPDVLQPYMGGKSTLA
jgi:seryl-tRNA synthetase